MSLYIGIDPGESGGIAILYETGEVFSAVGMPGTERDVLDALRGDWVQYGGATALLEKVSASPQMGVVSAFTFGRGYGALRMALTSLDIPFDDISPKKWQGVLGCLSGGDKNVTKRKAQALFPNTKITHAIADALLLAEFCRRTRAA